MNTTSIRTTPSEAHPDAPEEDAATLKFWYHQSNTDFARLAASHPLKRHYTLYASRLWTNAELRPIVLRDSGGPARGCSQNDAADRQDIFLPFRLCSGTLQSEKREESDELHSMSEWSDPQTNRHYWPVFFAPGESHLGGCVDRFIFPDTSKPSDEVQRALQKQASVGSRD